MKSNEIRQHFLDFFNSKHHTIIKSSSLIPDNDPTLLFVNAGMVQFKNVFLGLEQKDYTKATSVQRCVRAGGKHNDLDNVGYTARHHTFFEMLGNFSFGDYFKEDAIKFAWEFLTEVLKLPKEKLWITVYEDDQEAEAIWFDKIGINKNQFSRCGKKDNFWSMGDVGPCGPCTEIFYDHGESIKGGPPGSEDENGDRYIEIWNLVFMQYNKDESGKLNPLPKPSVDTGMGLERLAAILQNKHNNYDIDLFQNIMKAIAKILKVTDHNLVSIRVIADHIRSCAFMITDGIIPGNEGRAYVLRRIIRRAVRHGHKLGYTEPFFYKIVASLVKEIGQAYPELAEQQSNVEQILLQEESRFAETLEQGLRILNSYLDDMKGSIIAGEIVFKLYDTYGFPVDLTADIAREKNLSLDMKGYEVAMANQQKLARSASEFKAKPTITINCNSDFLGYQTLNHNAKVLEIIVDNQQQTEISATQNAVIVLDKTPFYAESGGQVGDIGTIYSDEMQFVVLDVQKNNNAIMHIGQLTKGVLKINNSATAEVDLKNRQKIAKNHSATHLLHAALRQILGKHISQKGSLVDAKRLRFDFSHNTPISFKDLQKIEDLVNNQIQNQLPVITELMPIKSAKEKGAMALFGEKYADEVRVLSMGDFSIELCGGTHIKNTADIGFFKITSESGTAAGVRRIEATSGDEAMNLLNKSHQILGEITAQLKVKPELVLGKIQSILTQQKELTKELTKLKTNIIKSQNTDLAKQAKTKGEVKILVHILENQDAKSLRNTMDDLISKLGQSVVLLASVSGGKIVLVCKVSKTLTKIVQAGVIMQTITQKIGGKGGGRADMAQGGGNDIKTLPKAMNEIEQWVLSQF